MQAIYRHFSVWDQPDNLTSVTGLELPEPEFEKELCCPYRIDIEGIDDMAFQILSELSEPPAS